MASLLRKITIPLSGRINVYQHFSSTISSRVESNPKDNSYANGLILSDSCKKRLQQICKDGSFLRVLVEGGGCSGFQYKFDLDSKINEGDISFGEEKWKIVIDPISLEYCNGATIDYHTELIRSGFRIIGNPKAEHGCSCGSSFAIKID